VENFAQETQIDTFKIDFKPFFAFVDDFLSTTRTLPRYVTGHSLGGAVADMLCTIIL